MNISITSLWDNPDTVEEPADLSFKDYQKYKFRISLIEESPYEFECVPAETSNFDLFCLCNPSITVSKAQQIWDYYRDQFYIATFSNFTLSGYRSKLKEFLYNQRQSTEIEQTFSPSKYPFAQNFNSQITHVMTGESMSKLGPRTQEIEKSIGLCLFLELQYRTDTEIEKLVKYDLNQFCEKTKHLTEKSVNIPNKYPSYFCYESEKTVDQHLIQDRILHLRKSFVYSYKNSVNYICDAEFGAVNLIVNKSHQNMYYMLDRMLDQGSDFVVNSASVRTNIAQTVPYLEITGWSLM